MRWCTVAIVASLVLASFVLASAAGGASSGPTTLVIRVYPDGPAKKATSRIWTLLCGPARGSLPNATVACTRLLTLRAPFAQTPPGTACTQIYGGPALAYVVGTFRGHPVERWFKRKNGCEIARWDRVRFLFRH
jgi:hypothetical protein